MRKQKTNLKNRYSVYYEYKDLKGEFYIYVLEDSDSFDIYLQETNYFDIDSMFGLPKNTEKKELTDIIVANLLEYIARYLDQHIITDYHEHIFENLELLKIY